MAMSGGKRLNLLIAIHNCYSKPAVSAELLPSFLLAKSFPSLENDVYLWQVCGQNTAVGLLQQA